MIEFHYETDYELKNETKFADWITRLIISEAGVVGGIAYIFCSDEYLSGINQKHLGHETLTDIITFEYSEGKLVSGDIFISVDRVMENAKTFKVTFENELLRVMAHGLLHMLGYNDKTESETTEIRTKEDEKIRMFHVEQ